MGQVASKTKTIVYSRLSKAIQSQESIMAKDALSDIASKQHIAKEMGSKYSDPNALHGGFRRGDGLVNEVKLQNNDLNSSKYNQELPEDLLKFLKDAGPLQRKVSKELTSSKVYESIQQQEEELKQRDEERKLRRRRRMPMIQGNDQDYDIASNDGKESKELMDNDDTLATTRTTNFSTSKIKDQDSAVKMNDLELFQYLKGISSNDSKYSSATRQDDNENQVYQQLLLNLKKYNGVPTLMVDTDKSIVGAWESNVDKLRFFKLKVLDSKDVQLIMEQEHDQEIKLSKKQSFQRIK